jgi:hypothetical protein
MVKISGRAGMAIQATRRPIGRRAMLSQSSKDLIHLADPAARCVYFGDGSDSA